MVVSRDLFVCIKESNIFMNLYFFFFLFDDSRDPMSLVEFSTDYLHRQQLAAADLSTKARFSQNPINPFCYGLKCRKNVYIFLLQTVPIFSTVNSSVFFMYSSSLQYGAFSAEV